MVITFDQTGKRVISTTAPPGAEAFTQMQANFSLFFGLAVQLYETTLISDQTPFDRFMAGDNGALDARQLKGLLVFINQGTPEQAANPVFSGVGQGNCVSCHSGPEFTSAAFTSLTAEGHLELIELEEVPQLIGGLLQPSEATAFTDAGFVNLGVRPTAEDLGRGGTELGKPLSFTRQALTGFSFAPRLPKCGVDGLPDCPAGSPTNPKVRWMARSRFRACATWS
jgi:hypothetical protein